jgi:hypothetical protein
MWSKSDVEVCALDSHQRSKSVQKLLALTADPEIAKIAKGILCVEVVTPQSIKPSEDKKGSALRQISAHWIVGIIASVGVSYPGAHNVLVRCVSLGVLFVWLVGDSWAILWDRPNKNWVGAVLTLLLAVVFSGSGYSVYLNSIQAQKDAAFLDLLIKEDHQSDATKPLSAKFVVQNNGPFEISRTRVGCFLNDATTTEGQFSKMAGDPQTFDSPLRKGGDGETYSCPPIFDLFRFNGAALDITCADVTVEVEYALSFERKGMPEFKSARLVAHKEKDGYHWNPENISQSWGTCTNIDLRRP